MRPLIDTLIVCTASFERLEAVIPDPVKVPDGDDFVFRYDRHTPQIVVVQKLGRAVTGLRAVLALLERGLYQEVGVMYRLLDEFREDVSFMCDGIRNGQLSDSQQRFINEFFQNEFDTDNPFLATQRRDRVSRRQIQAALARIAESPVNPSDSQELARTIANTNSGYVHGASEHILEMYGGDPPRYFLEGMLGTRRQTTFEDLAWTYFYRALLSFMEAAGAFGLDDLFQQLHAFRSSFEQHWGRTEWEPPERLLQDLKRGAT
jgi:hypothetical protein